MSRGQRRESDRTALQAGEIVFRKMRSAGAMCNEVYLARGANRMQTSRTGSSRAMSAANDGHWHWQKSTANFPRAHDCKKARGQRGRCGMRGSHGGDGKIRHSRGPGMDEVLIGFAECEARAPLPKASNASWRRCHRRGRSFF
jgi:hypothetical protein